MGSPALTLRYVCNAQTHAKCALWKSSSNLGKTLMHIFGHFVRFISTWEKAAPLVALREGML